jgi:type VI secretion system protein ImpH
MIEAGATVPPARGPAGKLFGRLLERGWEFDFFQAVWLLERYCGTRAPVGGRGPAARELLRFRPDVSVGFPATDVRRITPCRRADSEEPLFRVDVTFLGLYGAATPLPLHYAIDILRHVDAAEQLAEPGTPLQAADRATGGAPLAGSTPERDFLDILHHRLMSLFYRSWTKYRHDVAFGMPGRDVITPYLLWLIGCQPAWDEPLLGVSPVRMIRYAGVLTQHPRSAASLEGLLVDYWEGIPTEVEQFVGRWVTLRGTDLNRVGLASSRLGTDLTVGEQVYDVSGAFNIRLGPMDWSTYLSFLPDAPRYAQTRSLVQLYCPDPLSFSIEIRLGVGEVPETQLSSGADAGRLGYTSWIRTDAIPETSVVFDTPWQWPPHRDARTASAPGQPDARPAAVPAKEHERPRGWIVERQALEPVP